MKYREPDVRRIQKTGRNTFIVSLPKSWADARNVKAGTSAFVTENEDGSLHVDVHGPPKKRMAVVNADVDQALRNLISSYIAGAEQIVLTGKSAADLAETAREYLSAIEVIHESQKQVTLRVFATGQEFALDVLLGRMDAVVLSLFDMAESAFSQPAASIKTAQRREREANRLYTLTLRTMGAERSSVEFKFEALAANALENIADALEHFVAERPTHARSLLPKVRAAYEKTAADFFSGNAGVSAVEMATEMESELESLRALSALEWARLHDVLRYCVELEDTTADLLAIRQLAGEERAVGESTVTVEKQKQPEKRTGQK